MVVHVYIHITKLETSINKVCINKQACAYDIHGLCVPLILKTIEAEIAAHEVTLEEMRRRNVANLPPPSAEGKAARGGTMLDHLQVTLTAAGEYQELQSDGRTVTPASSCALYLSSLYNKKIFIFL